MKIIYSAESLDDLKRLRDFIAVHNPQTAGKVAAAILAGIKQLQTFPYLGVEVPQAPNPEVIRDLVIRKYVVRYFVDGEGVFILRIWHHREDRL